MYLYFQWVAVMKREKGGGKGNADDVTDVDLLFCVCEKRVDVDFHNNDMEHNTKYRVKYVQTRCFVPTQQQRPQSSVSFCLSCVLVVRFPRRRRCGHPGHPWCSAAPEEPQHRRAREGQRQGEGERWQQEDGELMSKLGSPHTHTQAVRVSRAAVRCASRYVNMMAPKQKSPPAKDVTFRIWVQCRGQSRSFRWKLLRQVELLLSLGMKWQKQPQLIICTDETYNIRILLFHVCQ